MYLYVYIYVQYCGCVSSHPNGALVSRVRGGHGHGAAASLGHTWALEHAGMEACVSSGMFGQVVTPDEALVTQWTVEALLARVCAVVTRQLVWSRELFAAVWPGALERALTWGNTHTNFVLKHFWGLCFACIYLISFTLNVTFNHICWNLSYPVCVTHTLWKNQVPLTPPSAPNGRCKSPPHLNERQAIRAKRSL